MKESHIALTAELRDEMRAYKDDIQQCKNDIKQMKAENAHDREIWMHAMQNATRQPDTAITLRNEETSKTVGS